MESDKDVPNEKGASSLDISFALGEVHGQLNVFMNATKESLDGIKDAIGVGFTARDLKLSTLEARVVFLEKWHYKISGAAALVGTIIGWAIQWFSHHGL